MILLDTCAIIFDALSPQRLSPKSRHAIEDATRRTTLAVSDISLWEIAMLIEKKRLDTGTDTLSFLETVLAARRIEVKAITPPIAARATTLSLPHGDPADRIILATAIIYNATLITSDRHLIQSKIVPVLS